MCGTCPYHEKCVFLHDSRIASDFQVICLSRPPHPNAAIKDTFYWPDMCILKVMEKRDKRALPTINQEYNFPMVCSNRRQLQVSMHDKAVYSLWRHFVKFLTESKADRKNGAELLHIPERNDLNIFTASRRLPVFVRLSQSIPEPTLGVQVLEDPVHLESPRGVAEDLDDMIDDCNLEAFKKRHIDFWDDRNENKGASSSWAFGGTNHDFNGCAH